MRIQLPGGGTATVSKDVRPETIEALDQMCKAAVKAMPKRIQRKRTKGFRLPLNTLCVSRPSIWGNPYPLSEFGELALPLFRNTVRGVWNPSLLAGKPESLMSRAYELHCAWQKRFQHVPALDVLRSTLPEYDFIACWCREGSQCHADILLELANQ